MEFKVDKENSTVYIKRGFAAPQSDVWDAWTMPDILDQWWAPKPWRSVTRSMEFKEGGRRLYAMVGPNGEEHWAFADYTSINPKDNFSCSSGFCDSKGNRTESLPVSEWVINFSESDEVTIVYIEIRHKSLEDLKKVIKMGFKEGFSVCMDQLTRILSEKR